MLTEAVLCKSSLRTIENMSELFIPLIHLKIWHEKEGHPWFLQYLCEQLGTVKKNTRNLF